MYQLTPGQVYHFPGAISLYMYQLTPGQVHHFPGEILLFLYVNLEIYMFRFNKASKQGQDFVLSDIKI